MARGKAISDEVRARVIAEILAGAGVSETARKLKLPKATISRIKKEQAPEQLKQVGTENALKIEALLVGYIESAVGGMKAISTLANDKKYLQTQGADKIAELHAELATQAFRLLEAECADDNANG